jgi:uncharacterized protein (TIGR03382 family)
MSRTAILLCLFSSSLAAAEPAPIVGGTQVPAGRWPDVVAVLGEDGACTGTLVAPDVVLTAGHCIEIHPTHVIADATDYTSGGERIAVKSARAYPSWWERFDVGVLVLDHAAHPTPRAIASACLANARLRAAAPLRIVGFGLTTLNATGDNTVLREATIPVLDPFCTSDPTCLAAARPNGELIAGGRGTGSCLGDSGGPAFVDGPTGPALVGVVSRGLDVPGLPCGNGIVYVRADKIAAWIQSVTGRELTRTPCDSPVDDPEVTGDTGCNAGGPAGLGVALAFGVLRRRRRIADSDTTRGHGEDHGEEPRRRDGRRRDDPHHLAFHQGEVDPPVSRDRPEVLRSRDREPRQDPRPGHHRLGERDQAVRRRGQVRDDHAR